MERQFLKIKHPSFGNRWLRMFKWNDRNDDNKIKSEMARLGRYSDAQRARMRKYLAFPLISRNPPMNHAW